MPGPIPVTLIERTICDDLYTASLTRPEGYEYRAGQWFRLTLDTPEGAQARTFSHASAPSDETLEFATRTSPSAYKQALMALEPGASVSITGPGGRLSLPPGAERAIFLIGGIGITPVRSLLRDAAISGRHFDDAVVFYGNRSPQCVAYLDELKGLRDSGLRVVPVYESADADWTGDTGFITEDLIRREAPDVLRRPFVVAGPPVMVTVMEELLGQMGVPSEHVTVEAFGPAPRLP